MKNGKRTKQLSVSLLPEVLAKVQKLAASRSTSAASIARQALIHWLKEQVAK